MTTSPCTVRIPTEPTRLRPGTWTFAGSLIRLRLASIIREVSVRELFKVLHLVLSEEDDGGFVVTVVELPGVVSEGDTREEAITMGTKAAEGAIETYHELGMTIPWRDPSCAIPDSAEAIFVRV